MGPRPTPVVAGYPALSKQRLSVLNYVRSHAPARIADIAAGLDVHPNTVREHLDALVAQALVDRTTEKPTKRGRPAALYRPSAADPAVPAQDYAGLATALAGHLARTSVDPEREARTAGIAWGHELFDGAEPTDNPRDTVLNILARLGFGPDIDHVDGQANSIALRRCPLLEAARRYPAIVCQVHLGIIEGVLERLGTETGGQPDLIPFAEPGACLLFLPHPTVPERDQP